VKKPSGLIYFEEQAGTGASPTATDKVKVHYHGTLIDGSVFDSSVDRGQPIDFALNEVIKCWTEGLQLMKVGGRRSSSARPTSPTATRPARHQAGRDPHLRRPSARHREVTCGKGRDPSPRPGSRSYR